ncbi:hypothetical protein POV27_19235 [Aureisphaera galaxeae]|uniref:hypothetical protein n=1 Tax=Aureisphaera galaxeae TaxID=1538023 RepID=UPI0023501CE7|nr:hypothetical protein [Aureisphaera galaxeae]MDC8006195.1 hypothetical protein [Aureisphaera galaxeae]
MWNKLTILLIFAGVMACGTALGQTYRTDNSEALLRSVERESVSSTAISQTSTQQAASSAIFIEQIGDDNRITANTDANSVSFNFLQRGDANNIYLNVKAEAINETVIQNGDRHSFVDFSSGSSVHNLQLIQDGNGQNLTLYGKNSISEEMKINMTGDSQSIIIRNFN